MGEKWRLTFIFVILLLVGGAILFRLYLLQVANHSYYFSLSERQHSGSKTLPPERGDIFFQDKSGKLRLAATIKNGYLIYINPKELEKRKADYEKIYLKISETMKGKDGILTKDEFLAIAGKKNDPFEVFAHKVDGDTAEKINKLAISGIGSKPENWRYYPAGSLASQILGFVGYKDDELQGRYGAEETYEDVLSGKSDYLKNDGIVENFLSFGRKIFLPTSEGNDLILTIEPTAQAFFEKKLNEVLTKYKAERIGGIILNPKSGKILAMASKPDFDPNQYYEIKDFERFKNSLIQNIYEFGSVIKPLTVAAGLDARAINRNTTYYDRGFIKIGSYEIKNFDEKGRGTADIQKILNDSLNTGAVFIQQKLGREKFYQYFKNYGLEEKTGVNLKYEREGDLNNLAKGKEVEYATASFGQGIAFTPLALARALSSLANGGYLINPYIAEKIVKSGLLDKNLKPIVNAEENRIIKRETSEEITKMLVKVADEALLGGKIKLEHYTIAAKTGTAQISKKDGRGYSDEYLHSFFGYAPAFEPQFLIVIFLEKPKGVRYASQSLGEPFGEIIKFLLNYYEVSPDR